MGPTACVWAVSSPFVFAKAMSIWTESSRAQPLRTRWTQCPLERSQEKEDPGARDIQRDAESLGWIRDVGEMGARGNQDPSPPLRLTDFVQTEN